ncbi:MAG: aryl-sulfate sulfotransferase [Ferruginibacter sp.]
MVKLKICLFIIALLSQTVSAQMLPADNAVLNFTQIMFQFNEKPGADTYMLTIIPNKEAFMKKTKYIKQSLACLVTEYLEFDKSYRWFYEAYKKGRLLFKSETFKFSIAKTDLINTAKYRYDVVKQKQGLFQNNLLFIENLGVLINRKGQPVWYLPFNIDTAQKDPQYRNLDQTIDGTFTYVYGDQCYEKNIFGDIIWKAPDDGAVSGDGREHYHHDFGKLDDGTYIACSYKFDASMNYFYDTLISRVRYNTVIQYDNSGKVLWSWNEKDHVSKAEIFSMYPQPDKEIAGTHMNGFVYDKNTNSFLFSFRDNSSVLRVDKATGKTLYTLMGDKKSTVGIDSIHFNSQHSPSLTKTGSALIYNNNGGKDNSAGKKIRYPVLLDVTIPVKNGVARKNWEYECKMNDYPEGLVGKEGSVFELPNKNLLVCIGGANKIFEVTRTKKVVWEMNCETYSSKDNKWIPFTNYRSHFISSLYPHYFTVQNLSDTNEISLKKPVSLRISNDGTDDDQYKIEVFSSNVLTAYSAVIKLPAQTSVMKNILLTKNKRGKPMQAGVNFVVIRITPLSNPSLAKNITYTIR